MYVLNAEGANIVRYMVDFRLLNKDNLADCDQA